MEKDCSDLAEKMAVLERPHRRPEDIRIVPIVIAELELSHIERKIFGGNLVVGADNAAFQNGPEAFNGRGMNGADNVLADSIPRHGEIWR